MSTCFPFSSTVSNNALIRHNLYILSRTGSASMLQYPNSQACGLPLLTLLWASGGMDTARPFHRKRVYSTKAEPRCAMRRYWDTRGTSLGSWNRSSRPLFTMYQPNNPCKQHYIVSPCLGEDMIVVFQHLMPNYFTWIRIQYYIMYCNKAQMYFQNSREKESDLMESILQPRLEASKWYKISNTVSNIFRLSLYYPLLSKSTVACLQQWRSNKKKYFHL